MASLTSSPIFSHNQPCGSSTRTGRSKLLHELLWCQPSPFDAAELVFREARSAIYMLCACLHFQNLSIWERMGNDTYVLGRRPCDFATACLFFLQWTTAYDPFDLCLVVLDRISVQNDLPVEEVLLRNRAQSTLRIAPGPARRTLHRE